MTSSALPLPIGWLQEFGAGGLPGVLAVFLLVIALLPALLRRVPGAEQGIVVTCGDGDADGGCGGGD